MIKLRRMRRERHVACMKERKNAYRMLVGETQEKDDLAPLRNNDSPHTLTK
jgi:hypothetical protein